LLLDQGTTIANGLRHHHGRRHRHADAQWRTITSGTVTDNGHHPRHRRQRHQRRSAEQRSADDRCDEDPDARRHHGDRQHHRQHGCDAVSLRHKTVALDDVTVNGGSITDNGTVHVDTARTLTLNGVTVTGGNLTNDGTIETAATTSMNGVGITNAGTIEATSGVLKVTGSVQGSGSIQVDAGAFLELDATVAATQKIVFNGAGSSEVQLDASTFGGQIQGMAATDEIDLRTIGHGSEHHRDLCQQRQQRWRRSDHQDGTQFHQHEPWWVITATPIFAGASDGHGGTLITLNAADDGPTFAAARRRRPAHSTSFRHHRLFGVKSGAGPDRQRSLYDLDLVDRPSRRLRRRPDLERSSTIFRRRSVKPDRCARACAVAATIGQHQ